METFLTRQFDEIATEFSKDRRIPKYPYDVPVFKDILDVISGHAIRKLFDAYENLHEDIDLDDLDCKCTLRTTYGIPCQHEVARSIKMNASLNEAIFVISGGLATRTCGTLSHKPALLKKSR